MGEPVKHPRTRDRIEFAYVRNLAAICAALVVLPTLFGLLSTPIGSRFLGHPFSFDDHMVYAAWMRQAMEGRLLMDNRFAVEAQPGLTIQLYFFVTGLLAKGVGLLWASVLAQVGFSVAFVFAAYGLVRRVTTDIYVLKIALALICFGGGLGYAVWHTFGREIVRTTPDFVRNAMGGLLPTDVWQPEGFVFPSMLTNGLFMASLCLILVTFMAFLDARDGWEPVLRGFVAMALLMNIHSYDVLLITLVMVAFLAVAIANRQATTGWALRCSIIGAGAAVPAAWFLYVLQNDPVFQSRAATETYTSNFVAVLWGYLPLLLLGLIGLAQSPDATARNPRWAMLASGMGGLLLLGMAIAARGHAEGYWIQIGPWIGLFLAACAVAVVGRRAMPGLDLVQCWALVGLVAPYFPALFQRKLLMGLSIPWAIVGALGLAFLLRRLEDRGTRNLVTVLAILLVCGSSARWYERQFSLIRYNVSNTTVHAPIVTSDAVRIIDALNAIPERKVVLAIPGVPTPVPDRADEFETPFLPDLNPVLSGHAGAYSFAGHWSETPDYLRKRDAALRFFLPDTSDDFRREFLRTHAIDYVVAPVPEAYGQIADVSRLGQVVVDGSQYRLVKVR